MDIHVLSCMHSEVNTEEVSRFTENTSFISLSLPTTFKELQLRWVRCCSPVLSTWCSHLVGRARDANTRPAWVTEWDPEERRREKEEDRWRKNRRKEGREGRKKEGRKGERERRGRSCSKTCGSLLCFLEVFLSQCWNAWSYSTPPHVSPSTLPLPLLWSDSDLEA